jgi:UDP-galactopyranose mutase
VKLKLKNQINYQVSLGSQDNKFYDYVIVGAGLYGAICAYELTKSGKSVLVIEKRDHIGGNCYTKNVEGIHVHEYGPHIFHTN